ncbi:MAG TPA: methyltransferase domain-containing protein [Nannocystis sp.]
MGTPRSSLGNWYERHVLAWILDNTMTKVEPLRAELLAPARGRVLEIGFGTGANLPHYPAAVTELVAVEPSHGLAAVARERLRAWGRPAEVLEVSGSRPLPFPDASFDAVVLTFVLCSVKRVPELLAEARRLLRPGAPLFVAEHVLARPPIQRAVQRAIRPLWKLCLGGCDPARDTRALLQRAGFTTDQLRDITLGLPWVVRPGLLGLAYPA